MNIQIIRRWALIGAGSLMGIFSPILVQAGCNQSDLTGAWYSYSMSVDSVGSYAARSYRCKVKINSSGSIVASKSTCILRDYTGQFKVGVAGGSINADSKCNLSGAVKLSSGLGFVDMDHGKLAKDKNTFAVTTHDRDRPGYITHLTAVKQ